MWPENYISAGFSGGGDSITWTRVEVAGDKLLATIEPNIIVCGQYTIIVFNPNLAVGGGTSTNQADVDIDLDFLWPIHHIQVRLSGRGTSIIWQSRDRGGLAGVKLGTG